MKRFLPGPVLGVVTFLMFVVNTLVFFISMLPFFILKFVVPVEAFRHDMTRAVMFLGAAWIDVNSFIMRITQNIRFDIQGMRDFDINTSYLVVSNHRSWADILILQYLFNHRIPFLKFFLKKELMWVPLMGIAWWALDYPFMKRYSKHFLEKHPELRGKDMETTRKSCQKFRRSHVTVLNFLEGTRFTLEKHDHQQSPFNHLLLPKAGGIAMVLCTMGDIITSILDVTIVYPENEPPVTFWHFMSGRIPVAVIRVKTLTVPKEFVGRDYEQDVIFRERFQKWVNGLWEGKDRQIGKLMKQGRKRA